MLTVNKLLPQGQGLAPVLLKRAASVQLNWEVRQKNRFDAVDSQGRKLGVLLPDGTVVRGGDVLVAEDGSMIRVEAAPQNVLVITPCSEHGSPFDLTRAAYHLGKHRVQIELQPDHLKIEPDHALADMLLALHLTVREAQAGFEPEADSHAPTVHGHGHKHEDAGAGHVHGPDCGHDHGAPANGGPASRGKPIGIAIKAAPVPHVHGPGCGHDH